MQFFLEVSVGGLLAGLMYSLVAIGFVLIYKASRVFNFAQGSLVLFAALTFVSIVERGVPLWLALLLSLLVMLTLAVGIERLVLRPLVNRPPMTLFMATLGLSFVVEGLAQTLFGAQVHGLELGIDDVPVAFAGIALSKLDLVAAATAGALVLVLALVFNKTRLGIALRAVADDPLAALAIGIDLRRVWGVVWAVSGVVGLVAGLLWGARVGVQFSLSLIVLKALPVLIIGGFSSVVGTIVAGLISGREREAGRDLRGAAVRRRHRELVSLRAGLAVPARQTERAIRRGQGGERMTIQHEQVLLTQPHVKPTPVAARFRKLWPWLALGFAFLGVPLIGNDYVFSAVLIPFLVLSLAGLGLNILTGYTGQLSLGSAAFMAVGAFATYNFQLRLPGLPLLASIALGGLSAALVGVVFGLPSLRIKGFYLIVSTLAAQFFVEWALTKFSWFSNDNPSGVITAPPLSIAGVDFSTPSGRYVLTLFVVTVLTLVARNLVRSQTGRNWMAVRDMDTAAEVIGIPIVRSKLQAFAVSSFYCGVAGALWAFAYLGTVEPHGFDLNRSFQVLFIMIIGGLGSLSGAFLGAAFIVLLPILLSNLATAFFAGLIDPGHLENLQKVLFGSLIIVFLIKEPEGLSRLLHTTRERLRSALAR
ncbi:MAG: hypothetical protein QM756_35660 [Polyangiaceae bacterium]